ncbi:BA75_05171T0 [Komagataella pastoris]|uniref:mannose-1-phosphate guanylyltransferase n=1 Tax=Komagataella pastoris TaxID=4922 RepID=A0A1B2JHC2_PICPA|nr:BA75_05171T0 [Komagataella pastoris]
MSTKAIVLVGGDTRGTRFRPLSLDTPKILFPIAGKPLLGHILDNLILLPSLTEIILIGFYDKAVFEGFISDYNAKFQLEERNIEIKYLKEFKALGTAGGLYHYRKEILKGGPDEFFVVHGDVITGFPFTEIYEFYQNLKANKKNVEAILFGVKINNYEYFKVLNNSTDRHSFGTIVSADTKVVHYVEKPEQKISNIINGGIYLFDNKLFKRLSNAKITKINIANDVSHPELVDEDVISLEQDVLQKLPDDGTTYVYEYKGFWKQIKTPADALIGNELYLENLFQKRLVPEKAIKLTAESGAENGITIVPPVYISPSAKIAENTRIGPYVAIGNNVSVETGSRISNSIILRDSTIGAHSVILNSILSNNCTIGSWTRIEGTGLDSKKIAESIESQANIIGIKGTGNITILGSNTEVAEDSYILNSYILPNKSIKFDVRYEIIM